MRKIEEGGRSKSQNLKVYLRKTKGGERGSRAVFPKCKQKELEVKTYGPLRDQAIEHGKS